MVILLTISTIILFIYCIVATHYKAQHPHTHDDLLKARRDAVKQSHSTVTGKVSEHLVPLLPEFGDYNLRDARFLGSPIDFIVFDGLDASDECKVVFMEVKTGNAGLTTRERKVRDAILAGRVEWNLVRLKKAAA